MFATERLALSYLAAGQAQKHVTLNEALDQIDRLAHLDVVSRQLTIPPASPAPGASYIPATGALGAWAGHVGHVMTAEGNGWLSLAPSRGFVAYIADETALVVYNGTTWQAPAGQFSTARINRLGLDTDPHATAGLIMAAEQAIFSHDETPGGGSGVQISANKANAAATASVLFQSGWQGRAEIGLCGNDDLSVKVSANGSSWTNAIVIDRNTGHALFPGRLTIGEGPSLGFGLTIARNSPSIVIKDTLGVGNAHTSVMSFVDRDGSEKVWMGLGSTSNSEFMFLSHYSDGITFYAYGGNYPIRFLQNGTNRLHIHTNGHVGIGQTAPTAPLHVNGAMRVGHFSKASLPSATAMGAGSMIFVPDDAAGATLAFSDGTIWRRVHDRQQVA